MKVYRCKNKKLHRNNGPAVVLPNGSKFWYEYGMLHREDGPAIEYANGSKAWCLGGNSYIEKEYWQKLYKLGKITQEQLVLELL